MDNFVKYYIEMAERAVKNGEYPISVEEFLKSQFLIYDYHTVKFKNELNNKGFSQYYDVKRDDIDNSIYFIFYWWKYDLINKKDFRAQIFQSIRANNIKNKTISD